MHRIGAQVFDIGITHIGQGRFFIGLQRYFQVFCDVVDDVQLVGGKFKLIGQQVVAFDKLGGRKAQGQAFAAYLAFDEVGDGMDRHMGDARTEVEPFGQFFIGSCF